jgi:DNA gyrase inhibitor GyrI
VRHTGDPARLQETVNALTAYIQERGLTPITAAYNATVKEAKTPLEVDDMMVDVYIGISPNIL